MMKRTTCVFLSLFATACMDDAPRYAGVEFEIQSAPPAPVSIESDRVELVAGVAVKVSVDPLSSSDIEYRNRDVLLLRSADERVLEVYSTENDREFVLVGVNEGDTCLEVKINRHEEECIDVRVLPAQE